MRTFMTVTILAIALGGCASKAAPPAAPVAPAEDHSASPVSGAALVLDVRNQDEYDRGHLPDARLIPLAELETRLAEVEDALGGDKSRKIVTYCGSGRRAEKAKQLLQQHGFSNVVNAGGYDALK